MKSRTNFRVDTVALVTVVIASVATLLIYTRLPDPMPTHFDLYGQANGWSSRVFGAWFAPAVAMVFSLAARVARGRPLSLAFGATAIFLASLHVLVLRAVISGTYQLGGGLAALLGVFQIVVGLILPRLRRNRWAGIRLPWTLASDENWARTHHFGGVVFVISGVGMLAAGLLGPAATPVAITLLLAACAVITAYSYRLARSS